MNALKNRKLNSSEERIVQRAVRRAAIDCVRPYEKMFDVCFLYTLVDVLGFGKKRARRIYERYWTNRDEVQREVQSDGEDGTREIMMNMALKSRGIDVDAWYEELGRGRLEYNFVKSDDK